MISLTDVKVSHRTKTIFEHLNFEWKEDEHWAVIGPNGSGKSAFLKTLYGKLLTSRGEIHHDFAKPYIEIESKEDPYFSYHNLISLIDFRHDFRNRSNLRQFYYQQRYNTHDADDAPTAREYLEDQVKHTLRKNVWTAPDVIEKFHLQKLLDKSVIKLSNGESKRLRLAAALLKNPKILMIDNAFTGLDPETRTYFNQLLKEITASGIHLMLISSPHEIPDVVTNVIVFSECCIHKILPKSQFDEQRDYPDSIPDIDSDHLVELVTRDSTPHFSKIVQLRNAMVRYGQNIILNNISWNIRSGERWALTGSNGSGKSTLLSLLNGDHPQAYSCDLVLFDRKRGTGESIWDIKRKIGFMSPELYQYFPTNYTCREVVLSGFTDSLGTKKASTPEQQYIVKEWMDMFQLTAEENVKVGNLPSSKQRLCLLARALVKNPPLLILDEPCQGLDHQHQEQFRFIIDKICEVTNLTLIYVTHYQEQLPYCIDHTLTLAN